MDPKDLKFTESHQWCHIEGDLITLGITDRMAKQLGDVVYIELPDVGDDVLSDEPWGEIESLKSAIPLHAPADGMAAEVNSRLCDDPDLVLQDPYGDGWLVKIKVSAPPPIDELLTYDQYRATARKT